MGLIYKQVKVIGPKDSRVLKALIDTGASWSFIRSEEAYAIAQPLKMAEPMTIELGKGETEADEVLVAYVEVDGHRVPWTFILISSLNEQAILGADFLQRWRIKLDPETEEIIWDPQALRLKLV